MAALPDGVEDRAGTLGTADEAEGALVVRLRQLGRRGWPAWGCAHLTAVAIHTGLPDRLRADRKALIATFCRRGSSCRRVLDRIQHPRQAQLRVCRTNHHREACWQN